MEENRLKNIFNNFDHQCNYLSNSELNSGHINDTYLVFTEEGKKFILQRINHVIFKDVPGLVNNKVLISAHLKGKFSKIIDDEINQKVLSFVKSKSSNNYYYQENGNYWNTMIFINDSVTHEIVSDKKVAYEGGKLLGEFLNHTSDFNSSKLIDVIPNFHDMSFRYQQYISSIETADKKRLKKVEKYLAIVENLQEEMHVLQKLKETGQIPTRVTHNDTKISNSLFDRKNIGICMIDTDTVMPGILHYDFGDAIRTICNTAAEDETDLANVAFNLEYYKAYKKGFLKQVKDSLSAIELKYLPLAVKTMIFIMALRFLTDYLNNNIYYKIKYPEHNLDRAKNQFKLLESVFEKL